MRDGDHYAKVMLAKFDLVAQSRDLLFNVRRRLLVALAAWRAHACADPLHIFTELYIWENLSGGRAYENDAGSARKTHRRRCDLSERSKCR